jgi:hypothetical protein
MVLFVLQIPTKTQDHLHYERWNATIHTRYRKCSHCQVNDHHFFHTIDHMFSLLVHMCHYVCHYQVPGFVSNESVHHT